MTPKTYLESIAKLDLHWRCFSRAGFVLKHGMESTAAFVNRTPELKGRCFQRAFEYASTRPTHLHYVEGFACPSDGTPPIPHAWCWEEYTRQFTEVTWPVPGTYYIGILFEFDRLLKLPSVKIDGVLGNPRLDIAQMILYTEDWMVDGPKIPVQY